MAAILARFFELWKFIKNRRFEQIQKFFHYTVLQKLRRLFSDKNKIAVRYTLKQKLFWMSGLKHPITDGEAE